MSEPTAQVAITRDVVEAMIMHCLRALPYEGCGLLAGSAGSNEITRCFPTANAARSSRLYTIEPKEHLIADRTAEADGLLILGVFHSHTHTDPYPSPTDVAQAPDPNWHYVLVSFHDEVPSTRSYRIIEQRIIEEAIHVIAQGSGLKVIDR